MQGTTKHFRAAVYADARWSDMRVAFKLIDLTASADCDPGATNAAYLSNLAQTHDDIKSMGMKLATLERDYWKLDETFSLPTEDMREVETGWWSGVLSGEDGTFPVPPSLILDFSDAHSSVGFTVYFDDKAGEWPEAFDILTFDASGACVSRDEVSGHDGAVYISNVGAEHYRRVEMVFRKTTKPFRRVRVVEIVFGVIQTFTSDNSERVRMLYEVDPKMDKLPVGEMCITIDNRNRMYNMVNPNGAYRYLQSGQAMDGEMGVGMGGESVELVNMGRYYYFGSSAKDSGTTAEITARDALMALDAGKFRRGESRIDTVWNLVEDILADSGSGLMAEIPPEIGNVLVSRALPVCSHREALRLVAQAACSACFMGRDDLLHFRRLRNGLSVDTLDGDNMEEYPDVKVDGRFNVVEVSAYSFADRKEGGESEKLYDGTAALNGETELWVSYSGPARNAVATVTGATLVQADYYLYAARLVLRGEGEGSVIVNGVPLEKNESVYTLRDVGPYESERVKELENPLVFDTDRAKALAAWRIELERETITYPIRERGNPAREVGDTATVYDAYGENQDALVVKEELSFGADGLSASTVAVGGGA